MVRLSLLPGGPHLALTLKPTVAVLLVEGTEYDDVLEDDSIVHAIVSDSEAVERGCKSRQSLDSRLYFLEWLNGKTGLDFFEKKVGNRTWEFGRSRSACGATSIEKRRGSELIQTIA